MPVSLWVWDAGVDRATLQKRIDDSDYVRELVSGEEGSVKASITELVQPVPAESGLPTTVAAAETYVQQDDNKWSPRVFVVADDRTAKGDGTVLVVEVKTHDTLRVVPGSLLEVVRSREDKRTYAGGTRRRRTDVAQAGTPRHSRSSASFAAATCTMRASSRAEATVPARIPGALHRYDAVST